MSSHSLFEGYTILSCGTLRPELDYLKGEGFLDADRVLYTAPGLHETPLELEKQLTRQLVNAKKHSQEIIVVYGSRCFVDSVNPLRSIDDLIRGQAERAHRIQAANCIDMLADATQRESISSGKKVYWLSPGWLLYWKQIFREWDIGLANETFPQNDMALVLDGLGVFDEYSQNAPERILEFSDWMKIPIEPAKVSLQRLRGLLSQLAAIS